ncbi:MAG: dethiobiotin synthase [Flavitalea sp.]
MQKIFVTGIGTGVGKTVVSAILTEALQADYWKPVQAGLEETDENWVRFHVQNKTSVIHSSLYALQLPASPHIAARNEGIKIDINNIKNSIPDTGNTLVIEGAGGLMVPLNEKDFIADLAGALECKVILVSRNYLGSINHSLLTAAVCKQKGLNVAGWIFNDQYMDYEQEIVDWSGFPAIASIPYKENPTPDFISEQAAIIKNELLRILF